MHAGIQAARTDRKSLHALLGAASAPDTAMLGNSGLVVSALGIGTLQWGDRKCGYGKQYTEVKSQFASVPALRAA